MSEKDIDILLVDDHQLVLDSMAALLKTLPGIGHVYKAFNANIAIAQIDRHHIDLAIIDISIGHDDGRDLFKAIQSKRPNLPCIALSSFSHPEIIDQCLRLGFSSYIVKSDPLEKLQESISFSLLCETQKLNPIEFSCPQPTLSNSKEFITEREKEILQLIALGLSSKMIADRLYISTKTVENHRSNIMEKLKVDNVAELITKSIALGYVKI